MAFTGQLWDRFKGALVFPTPKYAAVRDPRLALARYFWGAVVFSYVGLYQVLYAGAYLEEAYVTGTVQMTLSTPLDPECSPDASQCRVDLSALTDLPYCEQSSDRYSYAKQPCQYSDAVEASTNLLDSIMISTRISQAEQVLVCADAATDCPFIYNQTAAADIYFVADAEAFDLQISHYVMAPDIEVSYYSRDLVGMLYSDSTALCAAEEGAQAGLWDDEAVDSAPCYIPVSSSSGRDKFTVATLLKAADVSLDTVPSGSATTYRYAGMVLSLQVQYSNMQHWSGTTSARYAYKPEVERNDFRQDTITWLDYPQSRIEQLRHGVQVAALQTGSFWCFSFPHLLVQLAVALLLWHVGVAALQLVAVYGLDSSRYYRRVVLEPTLERSEMPEVIRASEAQNSLRAALLADDDGYEAVLRRASVSSSPSSSEADEEYYAGLPSSDGEESRSGSVDRRSFSVETPPSSAASASALASTEQMKTSAPRAF